MEKVSPDEARLHRFMLKHLREKMLETRKKTTGDMFGKLRSPAGVTGEPQKLAEGGTVEAKADPMGGSDEDAEALGQEAPEEGTGAGEVWDATESDPNDEQEAEEADLGEAPPAKKRTLDDLIREASRAKE